MTSRTSRSVLLLGFAVSLSGVVVPVRGERPIGRLGEPVRAAERSVSPFVVHTWTTDDGLPVNSVTAIEQTRDGYLWLGTFGGLARFDGTTFRTFTSAEVLGLGGDRILALHEGASGTLWIGTQENGVFGMRDGEFFAPAWADALPHPQVWEIDEGRDGVVWVRTEGGAVRVGADGRVTVLRPRGEGTDAEVLVLRETTDGVAFLGTYPGGLARKPIGDAGEDVRSIPLGRWQPAGVQSLGRDGAGTVWASMKRRPGLLRLAGDRLEQVPLVGEPETVAVSSLLTDPDGGLWVGTEASGLFHLDGGRLRPIWQGEGLSSQLIRALHRDREGNLWMGTGGDGLYRLTRRSARAHMPAGGLLPSFVPMVGDGAGGLWAGTICEGLVHFSDGVFERYGAAQGLPANCVFGLHRDADGTLWIARGRDGILRLREGRVTLFSGADGLEGHEARAILRDHAGTLWVGTEAALHRLGPGGEFIAHRLPVRPASINAIVERRAGGLWLGTRAGLFRFVEGRFTHWGPEDGLSPGSIRALLEDADGTLWVGTYGGGLSRLKDGRITRYTTATGLFDMFLSHILDDGHGRLWLSSNRGVFRVARAELEAVAEGRATEVTSVWFDRRDGMPSSETNGGGQPAGWRAPDGRLWFPTVDGLVSFDPTAPRNPHPPPVVIDRVLVDRRPSSSSDPRLARGRPAASIALPAGTHDLEIHYTGLSYRAPEKLLFHYRLAGHDEGWIDAGTRRAAYYTNLSPGRYRFLVRARNEDGVWSEAAAVLPIRQMPYVYQTRWFQALCAVLLLTLAVAGYRLRMRNLVRRTERLEAAVAARTAEVATQRDQLAAEHQRLQQAHGDLLAIFEQTGVSVCLVDGDGAVEFLSEAAEDMLGCITAEATGRPWQHLLPLADDDRRRAESLLSEPAAQRERAPVRFDAVDGRRYWIELDVRDDPRDAARRILCLHDVTELYDLPVAVDGTTRFQGMVGETAVMRMVYRQIREVATVDSTVILEGETGTGKELASRAIHDLSARKGKPYLAVNCAGLTESLLASQLFGHRRGAFTGAVADQTGLFEAASGGTLLLDEIGDIPPSVQASLLRVLQEGEIVRVGDSRPRRIDVRVVAATHRDLDAEVVAGRFRRDLYYRIRVARIRIPALRERRDDIPLLVSWFLAQARATGRSRVDEVSHGAMDLLLAHPWPGNVRELRGVVENAALAARGPVIEVADLPAEFLASTPDPLVTSALAEGGLDSRERRHVELALERTEGNRSAAARLLGISRKTLYRRLDEFGL